MKVPPNKIQTKYTAGGEFVHKTTNTLYQGYYYTLNGLFFKGETYNSKAEELIPVEKTNRLLSTNAETANYSLISNVTSQDLQEPSISHIPTSSPNYLEMFRNTNSKKESFEVINSPEAVTYNPKDLYTNFRSPQTPSDTRYFYKKITSVNPIIIKEIDKETYDTLKTNPLYKTTFIGPEKNLTVAEKELPGLTLFLNG